MTDSGLRSSTRTRVKPEAVRRESGSSSAATLAPPAGGAALLDAQVARLEMQMETLKAQVRQAQQLSGLGAAAATIAHEVNNLLTPMLSYARVALNGGDEALMRKALEITVRNVQTLVQMSERVLGIAAARVHAREAVEVHACVREAAEALCRDFAKDGIRFTITADDGAVVHADPLQLRQVLFNLLLNAQQAMAAARGGRLTVGAAREGDEIHITVADNGPGIAPEVLPRVFEPLQSTKAQRGGGTRCSGLGLALCRDLVAENGGKLTVESTAGEGTTFHIRLPAFPERVMDFA